MSPRFLSRLGIVAAALRQRLFRRRRRPEAVLRILVAHPTKMLGDTLLLTPLLAKLREQHPGAEICMLVAPPFLSLYRHPPYGVVPLPFDLGNPESFRRLALRAGFDLAVIPGDNRSAWLALALGSRWIVGFGGGVPAWKNRLLDEQAAYPDVPGTWADMVAGLVPGPPPRPYRTADWEAPDSSPFHLPGKPYCVLHPGAGNPLRMWDPARWRELADQLERLGHAVVFSGGRGEEPLVAAADPDGRHLSFAGRLDLPQLWHLLANAALLVSPDTGIAHLGRVVGTPAVTLFGQGSPVLFGAGEFWRDAPWRPVAVDPFPCRDMNTLFRRPIPWVRRCDRTRPQCSEPRCMHALTVDAVMAAAVSILKEHS
ncbi:MAG: glycosyltransferase family 9 protein [Candidatus Nitricoxidivorans perseverans]|uniref:Glycosyltransferase family 9 protein n=1 Tax=Candidatus Nitricoxidivorans perseverans TaxID=2975601 RepID=A0AA49FK67_9PROT|nr:MAG: glycosyltransferase family 9 protein [Candidatus Nitricoxidivorans perseverans]